MSREETMRIVLMLALGAGLAGCAPGTDEEVAAARRGYEIYLDRRAGRMEPAAPLTPEAARENELLERAISSSPDYTAAVRRAAIANVDGAAAIPAAPGARRSPPNPRARDAAIGAEEARLSEAVEIRRRRRLTEQAQQRQGQQDQQMAAQCIALGQQIEASMFNPRSLLNLDGAIAGSHARESCWARYQQSRM